jgi:holo-[acyl-carrier protein] synthase
MIFGIGTDIVRVSRIDAALQRHGERFAQRILDALELEDFAASTRPAHFLAKRFAAKEAAAKAFGTGFRDGLALCHIAVTHDVQGKPGLRFSERAAQLQHDLGIGEAFLSLADEEDLALAFVTFLRR